MATITDMLAAMAEGEVRYLNDTTTQPSGINTSSIVWPRTRAQFDADAAWADDATVQSNMGSDNSKLITDFNGGAWYERGEKLILWGGGHVATGDNSAKFFDPTTGLWDDPLVNGPAKYKQSAAGADASAVFGPSAADFWPYPNGSGERGPITTHSYGGMFVREGATAADDRLIVWGGNTFRTTAGAPGGIWARKLDTGTDVWEGFLAVASINPQNQNIHYDPGTDTAWCISSASTGRGQRIDCSTPAFDSINDGVMGWVGAPIATSGFSAPDVSRVGNPTCHYRRKDTTTFVRWPNIFADTGFNGTRSENATVTGTDPTLRGHSLSGIPGIATTDDGSVALYWWGKEWLYPFDTQAMKWLSPIQFTGYLGGSVPTAGTHTGGIWGKFQKLPGYDACIGCNGTNGDVFLFKLPTTFPADASLTYVQLERGIRGLNRGLA